jgi:putative transposase
MPRIARALADNQIYHILNRGNGRNEIFHKAGDYDAFIKLLREAKKTYPVDILAYCVMPNHFHFILRPRQATQLSVMMQWLMTSHVRRYHKHYGGCGHVWGGRYKSFIIQKDRYLLTVIRYIESNPVRAGLVSSARDWNWSSHNERVGESAEAIIDDPPIALPGNWTQFVDTPLSNSEIEKLRVSIQRQAPYGESTWTKKVCKKYGLESTIRSRGRPRKK